MKPDKSDKKIDKLIGRAIGSERPTFDFDKWRADHQKEIQTYKSQTEQIPYIAWRTTMKSRVSKIAAAALIVIGAFILLNFFKETHKVVLAGVLERVEQARAFMYKMEVTTTGDMMPAGEQAFQGTFIFSDEYGMKFEMDIPDPKTGKIVFQQMYILPDQKVMLSLMPEKKKYMRMEFDDEWLARMKEENKDPRETIKQMMGCQYTELGRLEIDGIEVDGFETTDPKFGGGFAEDVKVTLWVNVETWLPVLMEIDIKMNEQTKTKFVISDFQWHIPVVASDFEPVIPEDFSALTTGDLKGPGMSEEAALEGLKFFAEITGQYPQKIDVMSLMQKFEELAEAGRKRDKEMNLSRMEKEEQTKKAMDVFRSFQSLGMFYMTLSQHEKEPVYYGEKVGPDDTGDVLMRWKVSYDRYRVVFGDLSTSDVTAEELAELEKTSFE